MSLKVETRDLAGNPFRIGEWLIEPSLNRLSKGDSTIQLELKVMDVLVCLAERAGEVLTRQEIVDRVWATEFISDNTLTHAITEIRNALGDDARNPSFIETIHRRGYRLIAPVEPVPSDDAAISKVARFPVPESRKFTDSDRNPYPGLAAFTEADAEFFFGREAEVAQMWRKLTSRRLLAVIGPSGVGKSSFLRAGVIPARPEGWGVVVCQPGETPFAALARGLLPEFVDDMNAGELLVGPHDADTMAALVARWRERGEQAVLVVDQFEELFTLNPPEVQDGFAELLRRLVTDADVHVLLSMRDDFLYRCHAHELLRPIFEDLTALEQPDAAALRRALVEPAAHLGFTFEDDSLPAEMISEVEGERGALPLLAFAISRLWEKRDRDQKLLTGHAYSDVGGVAGALARHAEATIDRIGSDRIAVVRELFRNLVTSEGTRAVRGWDDLLSVFSDSQGESPKEVLRQLIDARLLTSYEVRSDEEEPTSSVEVVHESLLSSWPRLVRWQTQDADAAQLRDQLRQAARTWDEHDRTRDYLWIGRAYREFALWRGVYPGGLSDVEEDFAVAMTHHYKRRKRRRRMAVAAAFFVLLAVLAVVGVSRQQAIAEANRAEGAKLLALAQLQLGTSPTEALAFATASLELADSEQTRWLALEALAVGPPATLLPVGPPVDEGDFAHNVVFSADGSWAALEGFDSIRVVSGDGSVNRSLEPLPPSENFALNSTFDPDGKYLFGCRGDLRIWSIPEFRLLGSRPLFADFGFPVATRGGLYVMTYPYEGEVVVNAHTAAGDSTLVGRTEGNWWTHIDREGRWFANFRDNAVFVRSLQAWDVPPRRIASHDSPVHSVRFAGDRLAAELESGEIWIWPVEGGGDAVGPFPTRERGCYFLDDSGEWLGVYESKTDFPVAVWDLRPSRRSPAPLRRFSASVSAAGASSFFNGGGFMTGGRWIATAHVNAVAFWPLRSNEPRVLAEDVVSGTGLGFRELAFTPDGRSLIAVVQVGEFGEFGDEAQIRAWDLEAGGISRTLGSVSFIQLPQLAVDPLGRFVAVSTGYGVELVPLAGGPIRRLDGYPPGTWIGDVAVDADGRRVAASVYRGPTDVKVIRVWDLETEEVIVLGPIEGAGEGSVGAISGLAFLPDGSLVSSGRGGLWLWNVGENSHEVVASRRGGRLAVFSGGPYVAQVVGFEDSKNCVVQITDLETRTSRVLPSRITNPNSIAIDPEGTVVVSAAFQNNGAVQVVSISGIEPHLLLGHERGVRSVAVSPDGRWIASAGHEGSVRLWPMPDLSKPPLHTLPHDELIAKLKTLTNLRVVRDQESSTGWKVEVGPFPGWAEVPEW